MHGSAAQHARMCAGTGIGPGLDRYERARAQAGTGSGGCRCGWACGGPGLGRSPPGVFPIYYVTVFGGPAIHGSNFNSVRTRSYDMMDECGPGIDWTVVPVYWSNLM